GRDVGPRQRLADEAEAVGRLERRLGIHLQVEPSIADEVTVADEGAAVLRLHAAVGNLEIADRPAELPGGQLDERLTGGGGSLAELGAAASDAVAAGGGSLVGSERGVALDQRDALERKLELLARDLSHGDAIAGPDVHLAHEDGHRAVGVHG